MEQGLLWFDNNPKTSLAIKIKQAADHYQHKFGKAPNLCLVNPSTLDNNADTGKIVVRPYRSVLPGHLWIGLADSK